MSVETMRTPPTACTAAASAPNPTNGMHGSLSSSAPHAHPNPHLASHNSKHVTSQMSNGQTESPSKSMMVPQDRFQSASSENELADDVDPEVNITINNTMCTFSVRCHLNLRDIALRGANVEYRKEFQNVLMRLRHPMATATMWSSGKVTVTGAPSEELAKIASKKFARQLQKLGYKVRFSRFKVSNVLGTCSLPFGLKLTQFAQHYKEEASYEPELHPGATFKMKHLKASLKVYQTGSITVTAPSTNNVQQAIEEIYSLVYHFQKPKLKSDVENPIPKAERQKKEKAAAAAAMGRGNELGEFPISSNGTKRSVPTAASSAWGNKNAKRRKKAVQQKQGRNEDDDDEGSDPSAESSDNE